jgi:hypothetical protein
VEPLQLLCGVRSKTLTYWLSYLGDHPTLASLAVMIFELICNSVPSKRSFSAMNLIRSLIRGNLSTDETDMLCYTYMNQRQLDSLDTRLQLD